MHLPDYLQHLHNALLTIDAAPVECDGHTSVVSLALADAGIPHQRHVGSVIARNGDFSLEPHFWITIDDFILDYRLRMWVQVMSGPEYALKAPSGIFKAIAGKEEYQYVSRKLCPPPKMNKAILNLMTNGYSRQLVINPKIAVLRERELSQKD